jgi:hypothetical protein
MSAHSDRIAAIVAANDGARTQSFRRLFVQWLGDRAERAGFGRYGVPDCLPPFVPDVFLLAEDRVICWEVEDTSPVSREKMAAIAEWARNVNAYVDTPVELRLVHAQLGHETTVDPLVYV